MHLPSAERQCRAIGRLCARAIRLCRSLWRGRLSHLLFFLLCKTAYGPVKCGSIQLFGSSFLLQSLWVLWKRIGDVVPGRLDARPIVRLRSHVRIIVQRTGFDKDHSRPMLDTREHLTSTCSAEATLFPRGGLEGLDIFFPKDSESFGFCH